MCEAANRGVFIFDPVAKLKDGFDEAFRSPGPATVVLELEPPALQCKRHFRVGSFQLLLK
jgi:hypothetical protein